MIRRFMALAGDYVVDIFDEVDEELRAEKAQAVLKRYGGLIVATAVAVVIGVGGWQGWQWWQLRQDQAAASFYLAAMRIADTIAPDPAAAGNPATAEKRARALAGFAAVAAEAPAGYRSLARLRQAGLNADAGDLRGAISLWDQVAGDSTADPLLRDLANLTSVMRQIDTADPAQLAARLRPMAVATNPWHAMAEEQLALLDIRQGRVAVAKETLGRLARDTAAPIGVRSRAGALLARLDATAAAPAGG